MRVILILSALLVFSSARGQNLIGLKDHEIQEYVKKNLKEFNMEKVTNNRYSYLKYSSSDDLQTILFFMDKDSVCTGIKLICDPSVKDLKVKEYDTLYRKQGTNYWIDEKNGKKVGIKIIDEEWSFSVLFEYLK